MFTRLVHSWKIAGILTPILGLVPWAAFAQTNCGDVSPAAVKLNVAIGSVTQVSNISQYIVAFYNYALGIVAVAATIMVLYGGFRYVTGSVIGDIQAAKTTIKDAIAGMLLVFLAFVVLKTVNPETLKITMPAVKRICPQQLTLESVNSSNVTNLNMEGGAGCSTDADCQGGKCLRTGVQEPFNIATDTANKGNGLCTSGRPNERCRCEGQGCRFMNDAPASTKLSRPATGPMDTNNGGAGVYPCGSMPTNNRCVIGNIADGGKKANWKCDPVASVGNTDSRPRPPSAPVSCTTDAQCGENTEGTRLARAAAGGADFLPAGRCIRHAADGTCSWGRAGDRCRCRSVEGCSPTAGAEYIARDCGEGLNCKLYNDNNPAQGTDEDWFCAPRTAGERPPQNPPYCVADQDCQTGSWCIRFNSGTPGGRCSSGLEGQLCNASGSGHDVTVPAGQTTNHENSKWVQCGEGLRCVYQTTRDVAGSWIAEALGRVQNDVWTCQRLTPRPHADAVALRSPEPPSATAPRINLISVDGVYGRERSDLLAAPGNVLRCPNTENCIGIPGLTADTFFGVDPTPQCVRYNTTAEGGECSVGRRGERCRCIGGACGMSGNSDVVGCRTGLSCVLYLGDGVSATDRAPTAYKLDEWYCAPEVAGSSVGNPAPRPASQ